VELNLPVLEKLQLSGSGDVNVKGFKGKRLEFSMRGSGDLIFDGDFTQIQGAMSGSGDLNLSLANSEQVTLSMQGSGDAMLKGQSAALTVKLSGSGDLHAEALKAKQVFIESGARQTARFLRRKR
jgi:cytoskeletal protein CcmA (bactofilin family)